MENNYKEFLLRRETIGWAWKTARRLYNFPDGLVDVGAIAEFDLNLESEINKIIEMFKSGVYVPEPIRLLPQPKKSDSDGKPRMRQSFHISVRDQVAWIALTLTIGPYLDSIMPSWSYGHRLYKAAWYEEGQAGNRLAVGPYRHTSGHLYRRFKHSWPLFRRHISLTARMMASGTMDMAVLDEAEQAALTYEERPVYLHEGYWPRPADSKLYFASFDLEKFYPSVRHSSITRSLAEHLPGFEGDAWLKGLVRSMLAFSVSEDAEATQRRTNAEPSTSVGAYPGIPTGLMVAGFLSNVALLPVDLEMQHEIDASRRLAHFRFVDDQAVIAYSFNELIRWIKKYDRRLKKFKIGPRISPDKYDPADLAGIISGEATAAERRRVAADCAIDGSHPTKLMTRTLALVSTLAAADFNTMPDHTKEQRLGELEWLLLTDLPDREIRADTRAAFAAGKIASVVPSTLGVRGPLLAAVRRQNALPRVDGSASVERQQFQRGEQEVAAAAVERLQEDSTTSRQSTVAKYFQLLFRAFEEHPDKPRVLLRLLDYCRATGYDGIPKVLDWIKREEGGDRRGLATYLRLLLVQAVSRHAVVSAYNQRDMMLLERERRAAATHSENIQRLSGVRLLGSPRNAVMPLFIRRSSRQTYGVALEGARIILNSAPSDHNDAPRSALSAPSNVWLRNTGHSLGVWVHWIEQLQRTMTEPVPVIWEKTRNRHDINIPSDRSSLRKYPALVPRPVLRQLQRKGVLKRSDGGWLLEAVGNDLTRLVGDSSELNKSLRAHLMERRRRSEFVSLDEWVAALKRATAHDPRASEWTALQIVRLIVEVTMQLGGNLDTLDDLHPANILVPRRWLEGGGQSAGAEKFWTWESWRASATGSVKDVRRVKNAIRDYRRRAPREVGDTRWEAQFKGIGLLLFGLLRGDFSLPATWNLRGHEREFGATARQQLEVLPISSLTHAILEAALLPRNRETRSIVIYPELFFGARRAETVADTRGDPPLIRSPGELLEQIIRSQGVLVGRQISVLRHAPRQLIPMDVFQLSRVAVPVPWGDEE